MDGFDFALSLSRLEVGLIGLVTSAFLFGFGSGCLFCLGLAAWLDRRGVKHGDK